jgi:ABC-type nitrate/sulfonate/bicarbonate transport system permease component
MTNRVTRTVVRRVDLATGIGALLAWYLGAALWHPQWLPTLPSVARALWKMITDGSLSVLGATGVTLLAGLGITFAVAAVLSPLMASSHIAEQSLLPFVNGFLAVPHIALIPMFAFIWGNGETTRIVTTVSFALSPVILTWAAALKTVPADLMEMASSFEAGRTARARYVRIPVAAAPLLAGVRIGVVQAIKGVVTAEVIIGVVGIGKLVTTASHTFRIDQLYAIVLVIICCSIAAYLLLTFIENRMTRWNS